MKNILITGGAGFIGSQLTSFLLSDTEYNVFVIDNFDPFYPKEIKEKNISSFLTNAFYTFINGDIRNYEVLNSLPQIDIIVHLAAKAGVRASINNPIDYQDVNVAGTLNLLEYARKQNITQFVFASSSSVYGLNPDSPWKENAELLPISPYAWSKISNEMLGRVYSQLYNIRFIALRFFTVYGPSQRPDLAINKFFRNIRDDQPIPVYGSGESIRDYTHVSDVVDGITKAMLYDSSNFEIFNIGCGNPITLNHLIQKIETLCDRKAKIVNYPVQQGDVPVTYADVGKANKLLGYSSKISIEFGLKEYSEWFFQNEISPLKLTDSKL
ncbi:UDP-glucuronate 4-epimerase [Mucilaginibacter yixingensis]|uniref:UDP-glucuronate 4-epimerase n=1 Tax=Mucilaginibacter yixingensis TaxID=1295612 RepID=A0A2T5J4K3_9SPHI|nr:NAD-dependent epimerase/dehydratase family protein [Mucilaginibacter yixingensis]PTQ92134.1 UDP-glucuronate 4-epimerase [Mucilaginibacter yixingensis]